MRSQVLSLLLTTTLFACAGHLSAGMSAYRDGEYPEAKRELLLAEADSGGWSTATRAKYDLYRGLTHEALGDRAAATAWLERAKTIDDAHRGTLSEDDRARLDLAWRSVAAAAAAPAR